MLLRRSPAACAGWVAIVLCLGGALAPVLAASVKAEPVDAATAAAPVRIAPVVASCHAPRRATAPARERLGAAMAGGRFVAYQPTALRVHDGRVARADAVSIRADLVALRPRFDALITYDAIHGAEQVPAIAAELGYRALIVGVWDPFDDVQVDAALAAARAHPALVVGLSLGNEIVFGHRRSLAALAARIATIRARAPALLLSTTEPFHLWLEPPAVPLLAQLDLLLANVHPVFEPWFRAAADENAAQFVVDVVAMLAQRHCGPVLVKETGVPTAPATRGFSAARQAGFYRALQSRFPATRRAAFAWFAAFGAAWREHDWHPVPGPHPEEAHWGLFFEDRLPKPVVAIIPALQ